MTKGISPLLRYTFTTSTGAGFTLSNIPQDYNDLLIIHSTRTDNAPGNASTRLRIGYNSVPATGSVTVLEGTGAVTNSFREGNAAQMVAGFSNTASATSSVFGSGRLYIANYSSTNFKSIIAESVSGQNATSVSYGATKLTAAVYREQIPIRSISFYPEQGSIIAGSTISIYGIAR